MGTIAVVIIVVVVVLVVAGVAALVLARRRRQRELSQEFGPEYERRVAETGDRAQAEKELRERKERHDAHELRPLDPDERERFRADWQQVQRGFVDDPGGAVEHADALVVTIMSQLGYPVEDGRRRADDLSVAHPDLVEDYRRAQQVVTAHRQGTATTEDLRTAFTSFRSVVEALLADDHGGGGGPADRRVGGAGVEGATERIPGAGGREGDERIGHPRAATERIEPSPGGAPGQGLPRGGASGQGVPRGGAPGRGAPAGGPAAAPGRPPSAPPATGGPDGHQERRS